MNEVNKTLYIPLYGKAEVSKRGIILHDPKAEEIWRKEGFALRGKAKSKWLCYNMGMRSAVFDRWLTEKMREAPHAVILYPGCGMDSRIERVDAKGHPWYDIDFPDVIEERRKYYRENEDYHMLASDVRQLDWLEKVAQREEALIVMEGVSMYLTLEELRALLAALTAHFASVHILMDCYTVFAAKASRYKNPVNEVGVTRLYGIDDPQELTQGTLLRYLREHDLSPAALVNELSAFEKGFFRLMFTGGTAKKLYRLYEFGTC